MEHNKVIDLIYLAKQGGVEIVLNDERLQLKIPDNKSINKSLLEDIKKNKQEIIDFLSNDSWKAKKLSESKKINGNISQSSRPLHIPLSYSQERLWFIDQLGGSVQYHSPVILRLRGRLNASALEQALQTIVDRHEVLRTVYKEEGGKPWQHIQEADNWHLCIIDGKEYADAEALGKYVEGLISQPFDLSKDYMLRAHLININEEEHVLEVTMHHIASDAWSIPIIVKEVAALYKGYNEGSEVVLPPLELQYADYALWQRNYLTPEVLDEKVNYWKEKLDGAQPLLLPTDYKRPAVRSTTGAAATFRLDKELLVKLHALSQQEGTTLFMTLLAAFKVLLYRYTGQQDISVGTSIANRSQQEVEGLIGFFVNTLTFRDEVNGEASFTELLQQVRTTTLGAYEHQEVPFEKVVETVVKERDPGANPLFQVMLVLQNTPEAPRLQLGELSLSAESYEHTISKFDLTFFVNETPNGVQGMVQYRTDLFKAATIMRMLVHFKELLSSIASDPHQKVGYLPMLSGEEVQALTGNSSQATYPNDQTIVSLFEAQVQKSPDATAVVYGEESLTYEQLNTQANQLAHYLRSLGVKEDSLVPVCIERSEKLLIGILGILKAGAAYVPVDTDFPSERISYMLQDSNSSIVVSSKESRIKIENANPQTDIIAIESAELSGQPTHNPQTALQPHHLAYIIYTSGSTGKPKGVMIEHRHLADYVYGLNEKTQVSGCTSYALVSSIATDLGNTVIYSPLVFGGALHLFSKEAVSNSAYLQQYFKTHAIDCLKIVPSHWKALSDEELLLPKKLLIFGGEALPSEVVADIHASGAGCKVINHYGPTETTIGKLLHVTQAGNPYNATIPIGKPFSNTRVYVLSREMQLNPAGVPGQLYIAGDGVARGYLNNNDLTKEKFIANPFCNTNHRPSPIDHGPLTTSSSTNGQLHKEDQSEDGNPSLPSTLNPQPSTSNPQPVTSNHQPVTSNPPPSTSNPQPVTSNPPPSTVNHQLSTVNQQPSTLNPQPSTLNPQPSTLNPQPSTLMYATGDLVKYLSDGSIEFIGRADDQVKIRGYRVELGEIESMLQQCTLVSRAVVLAKEDRQGNRRLVAYIVAADGWFDREGILSYLKETLPEYMIPSMLVELESLPLTANGKVDRKALPDPDSLELLKERYTAPRNEAEAKLAVIWQDVLEAEQVGVHDDFFELGGHSLLAVRLISAIRKELSVEMPISDIFDYPTVAGLAGRLEGRLDISVPDNNKFQSIKLLVPIKIEGNKPPLYIVCGTGGTAFKFKKFSDILDPNQPVYGLQQPDVKNGMEFPRTIESIAEKYIEEILIHNPDGPYALSGHCLGGIIAFEMAKQLKAKGKKIQLLAMLDTIVTHEQKIPGASFKNFYQIDRSVKKFFHKLSVKLDFELYLWKNHTRQAVRYKLNRLRSLTHRKGNENQEDVSLEVFNEMSFLYKRAIRNYRLTPYDGEILVFFAKEHYYFLDKENNVGYKKVYIDDRTKNMWNQYGTSVKIFEVEGEHSNIFDPVHAKDFAMLLQQQLNTTEKQL